MAKFKLQARLVQEFAEDYCYKYCDTVVSILPKVAEHIKEHGLPLEKLYIVPNNDDKVLAK